MADLREQVDKLCVIRRVERPTFAELKETGRSPDPTGNSTPRAPTAFELDTQGGFSQKRIVGSLGRDFGRRR